LLFLGSPLAGVSRFRIVREVSANLFGIAKVFRRLGYFPVRIDSRDGA
jgi:hypothetical protein